MAKNDRLTVMAYNFMETGEDETTIEIYDTIANKNTTDWWTGKETTYVTPTDFQEKINAVTTKNIVIRMNSAGGEVTAANVIAVAIQEAKEAGKHVVCKIVGACASAAVQIATVCDEVIIHASALMMIHNPMAWLGGYYDVKELKKVDGMLTAVKNGILNYYTEKTGMTKQKLSNLMDEEKYMDGKEAVELGFADSLMFEEDSEEEVIDRVQTIVNCNDFLHVPDKYMVTYNAINKIKNPTPKKEGEPVMEIKTINDLMAQYPALVDQIKTDAVAEAREAAVNEGVQQERERMQAIDAMAGKVSDELLMKAKYETFDTAEKVAMEAITTGAFNTGANVLAGMAQEGAANNAVAGTVNTMEPGGADTKAQAVNHATDVAKAYFESIGKGGNK